ncbi:beta-N-acetylhexosaminidase [Ornithinibacillus sp. L9]|uniref:Beta-N-acetylhexosaminidase n=1 Tax=Ornithinibacillus caprae TaxID=2678566 RepID=A0A6N8FHF3_9BACI|nr:beta-N-acetylhexosaminidase [Ornithinibacillus caprae]MUK89010.1 beta-N-acetylhexosaminidase [Ornithinibacillus caprae]
MNLSETEKKIGQLMVFGFKGKTPTPEIKKLIHEHHVGGIILFGRNIGTPNEVLQLTTDLQRIAKDAGHEKPLLICIDQENGVVRRLGEGSTVLPGQMLLGATGRSENAYITGLLTGKELKELGVNWNLAPVLDVNNNPKNPVIGVRSYGETPEMVSEFGKQAVQGMQDAGIITTLKHFPGHGDTSVDSHLDLPTISHDLERLENIELKPFMECMEQGADTIMSAHVYFPAIEERENVPATLSKKVITDLLRTKLGFNGVVTTDCMEMNAISETIGTAEGAVEAIKAGVDLIMVSHLQSRQYETIDLIAKAVDSGEISMEILNSAYQRVMELKNKYLTWEDIPLHEAPKLSSDFGSKFHESEAYEIYKQGITMVKNKNDILPLSTVESDRLLVVYPQNSYAMQVEDKRYSTFSLGKAIKDIHQNTDILELSNPPTKDEIDHVASFANDYEAVIVGTLTVKHEDAQVKLVQEIVRKNDSVIVVATRSPYDIAYLPEVPAYLATYEFTHPALITVANALFGKVKVKGKLPVTLPKRRGV